MEGASGTFLESHLSRTQEKAAGSTQETVVTSLLTLWKPLETGTAEVTGKVGNMKKLVDCHASCLPLASGSKTAATGA